MVTGVGSLLLPSCKMCFPYDTSVLFVWINVLLDAYDELLVYVWPPALAKEEDGVILTISERGRVIRFRL